MSPAVAAYTSSLAEDRRLGADDVRGSVAHVRMLHSVGIITARDRRALEAGLHAVERELAGGTFAFDGQDEDIHSAVERRLRELAGDVAGRLHTGRSRNDQVATDLRLYAKRACRDLIREVTELQDVLVRRAHEHRRTVMPGYTHTQRAQVVSLAHHLLAHVEMLHRDTDRLAGAHRRADVLPLGSGALAGSSLPLDRDLVARELGFAAVGANSMDSVSDRDFAIDLVAACAVLMTHLSRLCEDMVLWSTVEFGFVELDDADATGSSMMPQKKNPDVFELARGRTGRVVGDLVALLTVVKGIPLAYDRDLQEDKHPLFDAVDTASTTLATLAEVLSRVRFRVDRMRDAAADPALRATDVAEYLVQQGESFRAAHGAVAQAVVLAESTGRTLAEVTPEEWRRCSPRAAEGIDVLFRPSQALRARVTAGGPGLRSVAAQLRRARAQIARTRRTMLGG